MAIGPYGMAAGEAPLSYLVKLESGARRTFLKLLRHVQERMADVLDDLARNPRPPGCKKLVGVAGYRVRKGVYRVLYTIEDKAKRVRVYRMGHRRDIYH